MNRISGVTVFVVNMVGFHKVNSGYETGVHEQNVWLM